MKGHSRSSLIRRFGGPVWSYFAGFLVLYLTLPHLVSLAIHGGSTLALASRGNGPINDSLLDKVLFLGIPIAIASLGILAIVWLTAGLMRFFGQKIGIDDEHLV